MRKEKWHTHITDQFLSRLHRDGMRNTAALDGPPPPVLSSSPSWNGIVTTKQGMRVSKALRAGRRAHRRMRRPKSAMDFAASASMTSLTSSASVLTPVEAAVAADATETTQSALRDTKFGEDYSAGEYEVATPEGETDHYRSLANELLDEADLPPPAMPFSPNSSSASPRAAIADNEPDKFEISPDRAADVQESTGVGAGDGTGEKTIVPHPPRQPHTTSTSTSPRAATAAAAAAAAAATAAVAGGNGDGEGGGWGGASLGGDAKREPVTPLLIGAAYGTKGPQTASSPGSMGYFTAQYPLGLDSKLIDEVANLDDNHHSQRTITGSGPDHGDAYSWRFQCYGSASLGKTSTLHDRHEGRYGKPSQHHQQDQYSEHGQHDQHGQQDQQSDLLRGKIAHPLASPQSSPREGRNKGKSAGEKREHRLFNGLIFEGGQMEAKEGSNGGVGAGVHGMSFQAQAQEEDRLLRSQRGASYSRRRPQTSGGYHRSGGWSGNGLYAGFRQQGSTGDIRIEERGVMSVAGEAPPLGFGPDSAPGMLTGDSISVKERPPTPSRIKAQQQAHQRARHRVQQAHDAVSRTADVGSGIDIMSAHVSDVMSGVPTAAAGVGVTRVRTTTSKISPTARQGGSHHYHHQQHQQQQQQQHQRHRFRMSESGEHEYEHHPEQQPQNNQQSHHQPQQRHPATQSPRDGSGRSGGRRQDRERGRTADDRRGGGFSSRAGTLRGSPGASRNVPSLSHHAHSSNTPPGSPHHHQATPPQQPQRYARGHASSGTPPRRRSSKLTSWSQPMSGPPSGTGGSGRGGRGGGGGGGWGGTGNGGFYQTQQSPPRDRPGHNNAEAERETGKLTLYISVGISTPNDSIEP